MGVQKLDDLIAWQLARAFKLEVYRLLRSHRAAHGDVRFEAQLRDSAASVGVNIGEGFHRYGAREFSRYLSIAVASLAEAVLWIQDGIDREHFDESDCAVALALAKRCKVASLRLKRRLDEMARKG